MTKESPVRKDVLRAGDRVECVVEEIFAVTAPEDRTEGRGHYIDLSYHRTEFDARIAASGAGVMGSDASVGRRLALKILGRSSRVYILINQPISLETPGEKQVRELRENALAKLSAAERAILLGPEEYSPKLD